jgi:hypothetical protein
LLVVLGYSRLLWCRFSARQDMRALIDGLEDAFRFFGGVPQELLFDQMKAVIVRDLRLHGGTLVHNLEFLRFAHHWGFTPRACRPYRAQTKGKVERPVRYLRDNFVYGRPFLNDADLHEQRRRWLDEVANVRVHGTTGERPRDRFDRDERLSLQPLAPQAYRWLVLADVPARPRSSPAPRPLVAVERRPLAAYAVSREVAHEERPALPSRPFAPDAGRLADARRPGSARCHPSWRRWGHPHRAGRDRAAARRADPAAQQPAAPSCDAIESAPRDQTPHRV